MGQEKARLLEKLVEEKHLRNQANGERLLLRSMSEKEKNYEANYAKDLRALESKWKLKIHRVQSVYKKLHAEIFKVGNQLRMEKLKEHKMENVLRKKREQLASQTHKNIFLKENLNHRHSKVRKAQQNLKHMSAEFVNQERERQKKLAKQSHGIEVLREELKLLKRKFHEQRLHERNTANTYRQLILHGKERLKKMTNENNLMMGELKRWKDKLIREVRRENLQKI